MIRLTGPCLALLALLTADLSMAQAPPAIGSGGFAAHVPITAQQLAPNVYVARGAGGNVGILVGRQGVVVIDTTVTKQTGEELLAVIAKLTSKPVTHVILTHADIDHAGGLNAFPQGIQVIAQENAARRLAVDERAAIAKDRLPKIQIQNRELMNLEGFGLQLIHGGAAHTDGDLVAFLPGEKLVFAGDMLTMDQFRTLIHPSLGGSPKGWIDFAKAMLALDASRYVPGHGDVQTRQQVDERVQVITKEVSDIERLVAEGKTLPEVQAAVGDPPPGPALPNPAGRRFINFSEAAYNELVGKK